MSDPIRQLKRTTFNSKPITNAIRIVCNEKQIKSSVIIKIIR